MIPFLNGFEVSILNLIKKPLTSEHSKYFISLNNLSPLISINKVNPE